MANHPISHISFKITPLKLLYFLTNCIEYPVKFKKKHMFDQAPNIPYFPKSAPYNYTTTQKWSYGFRHPRFSLTGNDISYQFSTFLVQVYDTARTSLYYERDHSSLYRARTILDCIFYSDSELSACGRHWRKRSKIMKLRTFVGRLQNMLYYNYLT